MVGLRAKLRAKLSRRNSGIQSVSTTKSSNNSTHTSESRRETGVSVGSSRPQSSENCQAGGPGLLSKDGGADATKLTSSGGRGGRGGSHSGKREAQATETAPTAAPAAAGVPQAKAAAVHVAVDVGQHLEEATDKDRDRDIHELRQHGANQGSNTAQSETADVTTTTIPTTTTIILSNNIDSSDGSSGINESDDDSDYTGYLSVPPSSQESTTPKTNTQPKPSGSGSGRPSTDTSTSSRRGRGSAKAPQNATNNSSTSNPGPSPIAQTKMQPTDPTPGAPISCSGAAESTGRGKLSSIDEHLHVAGNKAPLKQKAQTINASSDPSKPTPTPTPTAPTGAVTAVAVDATAAAVESVRRIRLSDPPIYLESATPPSKPSLPITSQSGSLRSLSSSTTPRPTAITRRQSLLPSRQDTLIRTLLSAVQAEGFEPTSVDQLLPISGAMVTRKIWVRRPGASATMVTINEEDLVDDVRDMILRKYANSLGRHFDAPDLTLRIAPREQQRQERVLGPDEPMARTLDAYFPGGQSVEEALIIDIPLPQRRTPKASPRPGSPHGGHLNPYFEDPRPAEASTDYFGPEAMASLPATVAGAVPNGTAHPHTISVLNTGQIPQIPSPGGGRPRSYRDRPDRPRLGRQHTSSPTILNVVGAGGHAATMAVAANHGKQQAARVPRSSTHSNASSDQSNQASAPPPAPPLPSPPAPDSTPAQIQRAATPPPRVASPRPVVSRPKKKKTADHPTLPAGMLNGGVPPISVLIVEDNIINLRLLEAFVKRLKVRWQTAMNGRDAVTKWRTGGFHLVLMDIQLPVMSGLEATREIRRLERMNQIGAFSTSNGDSSETKKETPEEDILPNREMFKSPVIIVALTASSLQSDRHEALAAGCNDFLTKPVTYVWLERKVMEWGCMQALIDFDGWRKWKDFAPKVEDDAAVVVAKKPRTKKARASLTTAASETH